MSIARTRYDYYLKLLLEAAEKENWSFTDVLRAANKVPIEKSRLASLDRPDAYEEIILIEQGRVKFYEGLIAYLTSIMQTHLDAMNNQLSDRLRVLDDRSDKMLPLLIDRIREDKKKKLSSLQAKDTEARIKKGDDLRAKVNQMNADLLARPSSEGWGSKQKRAKYIAHKIGRKFSYISKLLATPRNTNQP